MTRFCRPALVALASLGADTMVYAATPLTEGSVGRAAIVRLALELAPRIALPLQGQRAEIAATRAVAVDLCALSAVAATQSWTTTPRYALRPPLIVEERPPILSKVRAL